MRLTEICVCCFSVLRDDRANTRLPKLHFHNTNLMPDVPFNGMLSIRLHSAVCVECVERLLLDTTNDVCARWLASRLWIVGRSYCQEKYPGGGFNATLLYSRAALAEIAALEDCFLDNWELNHNVKRLTEFISRRYETLITINSAKLF